MKFDFSEFYKRYESILAEVDQAFEKVKDAHGDEVVCETGCSDCCYALFDLSLIEAMYLNHKFNEKYQGAARSAILERADKADREGYKIKRKIFKASQDGVKAQDILAEVAKMRVRCPLLNKDDQCDLYESRPTTCRLYGVPTAINGQAHTCGKSGFEQGKPYPTVNMEALQDKMMGLSVALMQTLPSKHADMADILVPVSMALMNKYDENYLGVEAPASCDDGGQWEFGKGGKKLPSACAGCASKGECGPGATPENCPSAQGG